MVNDSNVEILTDRHAVLSDAVAAWRIIAHSCTDRNDRAVELPTRGPRHFDKQDNQPINPFETASRKTSTGSDLWRRWWFATRREDAQGRGVPWIDVDARITFVHGCGFPIIGRWTKSLSSRSYCAAGKLALSIQPSGERIMPSPFPGMDPVIESQRFDEFHSVYLVTLADLLVPLVRPRYSVDVERYVFLSADDHERMCRPDVSIAEARGGTALTGGAGSVATLAPRMLSVPVSHQDGQKYLSIRSRADRHVVTVVELLSPVNKDATGGQREYLSKRANYLRTLTNVVEIDLLRGGTRLPSKPPLTDGDYSAYVIRNGDGARVEGYVWNLQERLPVIPIPLAEGDLDVGLDLQEAFGTTYDRRGYDYILDYQVPIVPPLTEAVQRWVSERLAGEGRERR